MGFRRIPLDPAPNPVSAALGIDLSIKRDDCTGLALGCNKVCQFEFHFGAARESAPEGPATKAHQVP